MVLGEEGEVRKNKAKKEIKIIKKQKTKKIIKEKGRQ